MICTEVGELMQRQLDYDLDEQELTILMTHLGNCTACQALFERLTLLSGSLEQLPRVTPSISIVDSILPELDAIDRQRAGQQRAKNSLWKRWMTAATSVAAAAIVVLVMSNLADNGNQAHDSVPELAMLKEQRSASQNNSAVYMERVAADGSAGDRAESSVNDVPLSGLHIEPLSSPIEGLHKNIEKQSSNDGNNSDSGVLDYAPTPTSASDPLASSQASDPLHVPDSQAPVEQEISVSTSGETDSSATAVETDNEVVVTNHSHSSDEQVEKDSASQNGNDGSQSYGIASHIVEKEKHSSPDGRVYITIDSHTIVLYETSTEKVLRTWELDKSGTFNFVEWSEDGSSFSYEWNNDDGVGSLHSVLIEN